jgi:hypothetical protein
MKKTLLPVIFATAALAGLLLLPGYNRQSSNESFPAPIEKPIIAVYANLSVSGIYDQSGTAISAVEKIAEAAAAISDSRGQNVSGNESAKAAAVRFINDFILAGTFKTYELFFYFRDSQSFALILHGEFAVNKIASLIGTDKSSLSNESLSTIAKIPLLPDGALHLFCSADKLILCPENSAGNIIDNINSSVNLLGSEHDAFNRMVKVRPALAAELKLESLQKNYPTMQSDRILSPVRHVRAVIAGRMTKLQLFVPDSSCRENYARIIGDRFSSAQSFPGNLASFSCEINGGSVFLETAGSKELERQLCQYNLGFLLHFFLHNMQNQMVVSSSDTYE